MLLRGGKRGGCECGVGVLLRQKVVGESLTRDGDVALLLRYPLRGFYHRLDSWVQEFLVGVVEAASFRMIRQLFGSFSLKF